MKTEVDARDGWDLQDLTWTREDGEHSSLIYALVQTGHSRGKPQMENALTVRIEPGSARSGATREHVEQLSKSILASLGRETPAPAAPSDTPVWLNLTGYEVAALRDALARTGGPAADGILGKLDLLTEDQGPDPAFRDAAVEKYLGRLPDCDIPDDGMVSKGDDGAYVMAFVYVTNAEAGFDDPDPDEHEGDLEP